MARTILSKFFSFFVAIVFMGAFSIMGCSSSGSDTTDTDDTDTGEVETFTTGGVTLSAATDTSGTTKTTSVTDADGATVLTMTVTTSGASITFPDTEGTTEIEFSTTLSSLPNDFATNRLGAYIAGQIALGVSADIRPDNPGCDFFPDTLCTLGCCSRHDQCFLENSCSAASWLPLLGSDACRNCNTIAANCITFACATGEVSEDGNVGDQCYDNRCGEFYTCSDLTSCECTSPCDSIVPASGNCGNGSCEVDEDSDNCPGDCVDGAGTNTCCVETSNCPSELPESCPGDCCCCGLGEVCSDGLCSGTGNSSVSGSSLTSELPQGSKKKVHWNRLPADKPTACDIPGNP